ncbi:MAG: PIN domain-containing protein [Tissierellia bacterium]|nr:PIN domain-containing protein [Tissierellia bacterium]
MRKLLRLVFALLGSVIGVLIVVAITRLELIQLGTGMLMTAVYVGIGLLFGIIFYLLSPRFLRGVNDAILKVEKELETVPPRDIFFGTVGLILGMIIAYLISQPISNIQIPVVGPVLITLVTILLYVALGYLGIRLSLRGKDDLFGAVGRYRITQEAKETQGKKREENLKILDTSVIIDGRIIDIIRAGFIEGSIVLPNFVLEELQHIADSPDNLRRAKGRRGLDILKEIQEQKDVRVIIKHDAYEEIKEVDSKLLSMAKDLGAKVITNDFNLNKVAGVHGINVLNINALANAVKPVVIPGEEMNVTIIKDGKEQNQGLGYLDDGTMIVVEDGRRYIGRTIDVMVTSVLQTSAGKMIFAKPK